MKINMDDSRINSISQLREFVKGSNLFTVKLQTIEAKYKLINKTIKKFKYQKLSRKDKHIVRLYLEKLTGYKKAQLNRLIKRALAGDLKKANYVRHNPHVIYGSDDIKLLEKTDVLHRRLNSLATKEILRRETEIFSNQNYAHISKVSASHINNLRNSNCYKQFWVNGTKARQVLIGKTKEPEPNGKPGSIRVDTVHQREIYHINAVDEITQWEVVVCVPLISERYLLPALKRMLAQFPFVIFNFHSDRGSEFINKVVADLLNKLLIEQTKSRSRHSNDNALVESKNGTVIRKNMGYTHIHFGAAQMISDFYEKWFNPYLNYHRPSLYVTEEKVDKKCHIHKIYGQATTPYEKLKEVGRQLKQNFLKPNTSFKQLDQFAYQQSDNQFATKMRKEEVKLFEKISKMKS